MNSKINHQYNQAYQNVIASFAKTEIFKQALQREIEKYLPKYICLDVIMHCQYLPEEPVYKWPISDNECIAIFNTFVKASRIYPAYIEYKCLPNNGLCYVNTEKPDINTLRKFIKRQAKRRRRTSKWFKKESLKKTRAKRKVNLIYGFDQIIISLNNPNRIPIENRHYLRLFDPTIKGMSGEFVYVLFDNNTIVYIGKTNNPYSRIYAHRKDKKYTHYQYFSVCPNRVYEIESRLIKYINPKYNKKGV